MATTNLTARLVVVGELIAEVLEAGEAKDAAQAVVDRLTTLPGARGGLVAAGSPSGQIDLIARSGGEGVPESTDDLLLRQRSPLTDALVGSEPVWAETPSRLRQSYPLTARRTPGWAAIHLSAGNRDAVLAIAFDRATPLSSSSRQLVQIAASALSLRLAEIDVPDPDEATVAVDAVGIASAIERSEVLAQVAEVAVPRVADWCAVYLRENDRLERLMTAHRDPAPAALAARTQGQYPFRLGDPVPVVDAFRRSRPNLIAAIDDETRESLHPDPEYRAICEQLGMHSLMHVPLVAHDETIGIMTFVSASPNRRFDDEDLALAELVGRHAASALSASATYEQERAVSEALQRTSLPPSLPQPKGWQIASRYVPSRAAEPVGGDWYDAIVREDGRLVLIVGDVAGHGIDAATLMSQLRNLTRAYAYEGHPPDEVLRLVNRILLHEGTGDLATCAIAEVDLASGVVRVARAGHLPPLLRAGTARLLDSAGGPPLGAFADVEFPISQAWLGPGSLLLLYTDGLVERRGQSIDEGLSRLRRAVEEEDAQAAGPVCDGLLRDGPVERERDDVCLLAIAREQAWEPVFERAIPPNTSEVAHVRAEFGEWVRSVGGDDRTAADFELSLSELLANAIVASVENRDVEIRARAANSTIELTVSNVGPAFEVLDDDPDPLAPRGRGLRIVRAAMDELRIGHDGTRSHVTCRLQRAAD